MRHQTRRKFLADVGRGMLIASVGSAVAADLGIGSAFADEGSEALTFGKLEPLVGLMQETPLNRLLPTLVGRLREGTDLQQLVGAAALANARSFGGEDYVGFHTLMALAPAYHMARELPQTRQPLPVLKVLYRNSNRIQEKGGRQNEVLHRVQPGPLPQGQLGGEALREAVRRKDMDGAERTFAALAQGSPEEAFNHLLYAVQDNTEVHRVVLPARAWDLVGLIGQEQAHTLLRQSVRYCVRFEAHNRSQSRTLLPTLLEQHQLLNRPLGTRAAEDSWVERMSQTIFRATPEQAAEAAAAALAEGMAPDAVAEAISLAANQLILRDAGRPAKQTSPGKPVGSVHGDSIGVHACDSTNAWRNMARVSNPRNQAACLILAAYQVALDRINRGGDFLNWQPQPRQELLDELKTTDRAALLHEAETAIRNQDQARACAVVHRYGELGYPPRPVFDLLLRYAISEEGALHAEKYYRTVTEEFAATRPAFRWRQLTALARVTASEFGQPAAGYAEACQLLQV
ncbi:MAG: hypothetical protein L0Z62_17985 [Gemmataceae bacterium]|nr:hypothetical protein [Gemmataceae bacterium]